MLSKYKISIQALEVIGIRVIKQNTFQPLPFEIFQDSPKSILSLMAIEGRTRLIRDATYPTGTKIIAIYILKLASESSKIDGTINRKGTAIKPDISPIAIVVRR